MRIVDIICSICTEVFKNSDQIYSTNCGHLFHFKCMDDWLGRNRSCPQCRYMDPTYHVVHFSFEESEENYEDSKDLEIKLKSSEENVAALLLQKEEKKSNFLELQKQFTTAEKVKNELQESLGRMGNTERDFLVLQGQYTEKSEKIRQLEDKINQLVIENECKKQQLEQKPRENEQLKSHLHSDSTSLPEHELNEKIKVIEKKIKLVTEELEKEVGSSTRLSIEKMKLESYIKNFHSLDAVEIVAPKENEKTSTSKKRNSKKKRAPQNSHQKENKSVNSLFIKGIPLSQITFPIESVVLNLALKMNIDISPDDLTKVTMIEVSSWALISVEFKSREVKDKFLSNKKTLKNRKDTQSIFIVNGRSIN